MPSLPRVTIVLAVHNDEATVERALASCLAQSVDDIEIICVDDASTDGTAGLLERLQGEDPRIRVIQHDRNMSALQARRTGVMAAGAPYILFLDGDDELMPDAAATSLHAAADADADLVGFAVRVVANNGGTVGGYQSRLAPRHASLSGDEVLTGLFPLDKPAQGQLWRYLFRASIVREAYSLIPEHLSLPRVNDLPLLFLVATLSTRYVSVPNHLYLYRYGQGESGQAIDTIERAHFYASAIQSIDSIEGAVRSIARRHANAGGILDAYDSVRASIVGYTAAYLVEHSPREQLPAILGEVRRYASETEITLAAIRFYPDSLPALKSIAAPTTIERGEIQNVLLTTRALTTGGVSGVLLTQAKILRDAGYRVVIVARRGGSERNLVPSGVDFLEMNGRGLAARAQEWAQICRAYNIHLVVDHQILYSRDWPEFALVARSLQIATIGWIHNFAGRPSYDHNGLHSLLKDNLPLLDTVVTLSPLDVAFWKLRGIPQTVFIPNPPSGLLINRSHEVAPKQVDGRAELVWWGRLDEHTKQVTELLNVATELRRLRLDFHLTVIGPEWQKFTPDKFNKLAEARGLKGYVEAVGPLHGDDLIAAINRSHAFVSTSIIEGYQLTIPEAQAHGLPIFMYELPWLTVTTNNDGLVSVPQKDSAALAKEIFSALTSPIRYQQLSRSALAASSNALGHDFAALYEHVISGTLPAEYSPEPDLEHARQLLNWTIFYAEQAAAPSTSAGDRLPGPVRNNGRGVSRSATVGRRVLNAALPIGTTVLQVFPSLRPLAHRMRQWLRARRS